MTEYLSYQQTEAEAADRANLAEAVRAMPKAGPKNRKGPLTPEERIAAIRQVVTSWQCARVEGLLVDGTTARAIVTVYDALNETNKAKMATLPVRKMAAVAWKLVR